MDEGTKALIRQLRVWRRSEFGQSPPGYMFEAAADALQAQAERVKALEEEALVQAFAAHREAAIAERDAQLVKWLRGEREVYPATEYSGFCAMIADDIESGEPWK